MSVYQVRSEENRSKAFRIDRMHFIRTNGKTYEMRAEMLYENGSVSVIKIPKMTIDNMSIETSIDDNSKLILNGSILENDYYT